MLKGKLPQRAQCWHANIVKIAQPQRFSAEKKIETTIIMNFETYNKFKIFPLRSLCANRAEIRYRFRCSRTAPEIHLKFARRTVRVETVIAGKLGDWNICNWKKYNLLPLQILSSGSCIFFVIVFSFVMCILNICRSHILKHSFFNKKQRKQKKNETKTNF